jgi:hypothetical protein
LCAAGTSDDNLLKENAQQRINKQWHQNERDDGPAIAEDFSQLFGRQPRNPSQ